jgi:hypothetical protein
MNILDALRQHAAETERQSHAALLAANDAVESLSTSGALRNWLVRFSEGILTGDTKYCRHIKDNPLQRSFVRMWDKPLMMRCHSCATAVENERLPPEEESRCDLCGRNDAPVRLILVSHAIAVIMGGQCDKCAEGTVEL